MNILKELKKLAADLLEESTEEEDHSAFLEELREYIPEVEKMQEALNQIQAALTIAKGDIALLDTPRRSGPLLEMMHGLYTFEKGLSSLTNYIWGYPLHQIRHY